MTKALFRPADAALPLSKGGGAIPLAGLLTGADSCPRRH